MSWCVKPPVSPSSDSPGVGPAVERTSWFADEADQPKWRRTLPLSSMERLGKQQAVRQDNPERIPYDFSVKGSPNVKNIRAKHVCSDTDPHLVLAPGNS